MFLYGASGHAKVIIDILRANHERVEGLFDDDENLHTLLGYPVQRAMKVRGPLIISIGNNSIRKRIAESLDVEFGKAIHPSAIVSEEASIEEGSAIMQGAIVQSDVYIGRHCIINTGASVKSSVIAVFTAYRLINLNLFHWVNAHHALFFSKGFPFSLTMRTKSSHQPLCNDASHGIC